MIAYAELAVLALLLLGGKKKPEEGNAAAARTSPLGVKIPDGGLVAPAPVHEDAPAAYAPPIQQPAIQQPYVPPTPQPGPAAPAAPTPLQTAAQVMLSTLEHRMSDGSGRGAYRVEDMEVYKSFQRAARVTSDGMPGKGTMDRLKGVLSSMGLSLPPEIPIYPWKGAGGFHHPNAPEMREWDPSKVAVPAAAPRSPAVPAAPVVPAGPITTSGFTKPGDILTHSLPDPAGQAAIAMANVVVTRYLDKSGHGPYRKADQAWYMAFQKLDPVLNPSGTKKPDGFPGVVTMKRLQEVVAKAGVVMPATLPTFPFKKFDAPGDIRSVDWNAPTNPNLNVA
jgi:hypothetical protein